MKLEKIIVKGLFGVFNHEILIKEHITILVSENGYGKTMILKMLKALFEQNIVFFHAVIFEEFIIEFEGGKIIVLAKDKKKCIYLNGNLVLDNEKYQSEMLITIKNAYTDKLPEDISIIDLIQSTDYNRFDRFKEMYNRREIRNNIRAAIPFKVDTLIINTNRVDGFLSTRQLQEYYTRSRQDENNQYFTKIVNSFFVHKRNFRRKIYYYI